MTEKKVILNEIRNELNVPKSQFNSYGKYNFRNVEDIYTAVKPLLAKYNANLYVNEKILELGNRLITEETVIYKDSDLDSPLEIKGYAEISQHKGMSPEQCFGTASSYATKYALGKLFLIDDSVDTDSMDSRPAVNKTTKQASKKAPIENVDKQALFDKAVDTELTFEGMQINLMQLYQDAKKNGKESPQALELKRLAQSDALIKKQILDITKYGIDKLKQV